MARVRDQHLGVIQGQVGPQVFKVVNGESYVAQMPHRSQVEPSEAVKTQRKRFGLAMKFVKAVYALIILRIFWKQYVPENTNKVLTTSNKIGKANFPSISATDISDLAVLVPDFGFPVTTTDITLTNSSFTVEVEALGDTGIIDTNKEKFVYLACVTHLTEPINNTLSTHRFLSLVSAKVNLSTSTALTFTITLDSAMGQVFDSYTTKKAFFVLVTTDISDVPVHFSSTFHTA